MEPLAKVFNDINIHNNLKHCRLDKVKLYPKRNAMRLAVCSDVLVEKDWMDEFCFNLKKQYGIKKAEILLEYSSKVRFDYDTAEECMQYLYSYIVEKFSPVLSIMRNSSVELEGEVLTIHLAFGGKDVLIANDVDKMIASLIKDQFNKNIKVEFDERAFDKEAYLERKAKERQSSVADIKIKAETEKAKKSAQTSGSIIIGKGIKTSPEPMNTLNGESGRSVVEGEIFKVESRELRGGKTLLSCYVTDKTSSILAKFFIEPDKAKDITSKMVVGAYVKLRGDISYDKFVHDITMTINDAVYAEKPIRTDSSDEKRVELHLHTQMSALDAVSSAKELIKRAASWGHKAIAITDHGVVQAFPDAYRAGCDNNIKIIYGVEAYLVSEMDYAVKNPVDLSLHEEFVVFDIETTGLDSKTCGITEIAGVKIKDGEITDRFSTFVNPEMSIPVKITQLTGITEEMVKDAPKIAEVLPKFLEFAGECPLVAHNAGFDVGFISVAAQRLNIDFGSCYVDTLRLSRTLLPEITKHKLDVVAEHLGASLDGHHRAINDAECTAHIFAKFCHMLKNQGISNVNQINKYSYGLKNKEKMHHAVILVKDMTGLRNLYKLISKSHMEFFHKKPRIPKDVYLEHKEGLIIGSACEAGELYTAILENAPDWKIKKLVDFYDYLEIQPIGNNEFMVRKGIVPDEEALRDINRKIVELGKKYGKLVVATCDVHFIDPDTEVIRRILQAGQGYEDADKQAPLFFRTTEEMLKEFLYLGEETAYEVVVTNPNKINEMIGDVLPIPKETYAPEILGAEEDIQRMSMEKAKRIYGDDLPKIVSDRIEKELNSIIKNGFSVMYMIAHKLVGKSLSDGYLVGSRGSVGSSFIAFLTDITEVNALPPHYVCKKCKHSEFIEDGSVSSGVDMEDKECPVCGEMMYKDGHDIPFETFLGFDGDKEPDIDLNFSGEYQQTAHKYTEELFGKGHVFKAGTIGTFADKTAYGYVKKYYEERGKVVTEAEITRLVKGFEGIKRTTGQHPGGLMIVPQKYDVNQFTPIQRPADKTDSDIVTTHFDYHSISGRLLKLDELGHDDPTMIKMLEDLTGTNAREISLSDKGVMKLFTSTESLGVTPEDIGSQVGTYAVPEFGTKFVRQMLLDTKPTTFSELVRISGLSHGTDVWLNNAQDIVKNNIAPFSQTICTRDDIMLYLLYHGLEPLTAFKIMEDVRKGKGLKPEYIEAMKANNVPQWYIDSCQKINYMFPKAHAVAYVTMAYRIAYYKVYYPIEFYIAYYTVRADDFDAELMTNGQERVREKILELEDMGKEIKTKDQNVLTILEVCNEMYARGIEFLPIDLYESDGFKFRRVGDKIRPPLNSLAGVGDTAVRAIVSERENGEFATVEELVARTKINKTAVEVLKQSNVLKDIPDSAQMSLFNT